MFSFEIEEQILTRSVSLGEEELESFKILPPSLPEQ